MSEIKVDSVVNAGGDNDSGIDLSTNDVIKFDIAGSEKARVDSSGNLLVAKTATGIATVGAELKSTGELLATVSGDACAFLNRTSSDGDVAQFRKDGTTVGSIGVGGTSPSFGSASLSKFIAINNNGLIPASSSSVGGSDNAMTLGQGSRRYSVVHAGTGTISTSDLQEKQDIEVFSDAEMKVAKKISSLFKKFKFKDAVTVKGDDARIHSGVIAQEIESAFKEEKLDASNYAFWCKDTWTNDDGKEQTRYAIRYDQLLSFICAYNEQRFSSIEARLTALESK